MLVTVGVQMPLTASCSCPCMCTKKDRNHMVGSGRRSIPIIDTTALNCDHVLFLDVFSPVIFKSNIIFCSCWELHNDIRTLFLKWITYLSFVIWGVEDLRRLGAKTLCFESVNVTAYRVTDNMSVQTGNELEPKCDWMMNTWYVLLWRNGMGLTVLNFKLYPKFKCWHWLNIVRAKFDCWGITLHIRHSS